MLALRSSAVTSAAAATRAAAGRAPRRMLPSGGGGQPSRSITMFGFKWPWGGSSDSGSSGGKFESILKAARAPRKRGCELAPAEAPPGLKLATFGGG